MELTKAIDESISVKVEGRDGETKCGGERRENEFN